MTDNERHERLAVMHERCLGCQNSRGGFGYLGNVTRHCKTMPMDSFWATSCAVASVSDWAAPPTFWWGEYASPPQCTRMTSETCPQYRRVDATPSS